MSFLHLLLVAAIQGITEFLPISSSGHLILLPALTGMDDQGLAIDVAVHVGTLAAVILYFRKEVGAAIAGLGDIIRGRVGTRHARLALLLIVSTIPVVLAGLVVELTGLDLMLRSTAVIGWTMLGFGLVLYWADRTGAQTTNSAEWRYRDAVIIGLWQVLALIPGTSRSGITITGALRLGYDRESAARIAMLMSIPTIAASGLLLAGDVIAEGNWALLRDGAIGAALSFLTALGALTLMMRLLRSISFTPYVIYRVAVGVVLLWIAYSGS